MVHDYLIRKSFFLSLVPFISSRIQIGVMPRPGLCALAGPAVGLLASAHFVSALGGFAAVAAFATVVAGCASRSSDITPAYVSPITYQNHNCQQLAMEAQAISARAAQVSGAQDQKRTNDQIATGVAIVVFWPAAFSSSV